MVDEWRDDKITNMVADGVDPRSLIISGRNSGDHVDNNITE